MNDCYSKALFDLAVENNTLDDIKEQFQIFKKIYKNDLDFQKFLNAKNIDKSNKKDFLDKTLKDFNKSFVSFLKVLIDSNKIDNLLEIYIKFVELYQEKNNIMFFEIHSAKKLSEEEINVIRNKLKKIYLHKIEIKNYVDESLIGGIKITNDGVALDNTLIGQLEVLKANL
jgi:F-type H+-transporting ATPase subunit delta